jgi:hypothetical protein
LEDVEGGELLPSGVRVRGDGCLYYPDGAVREVDGEVVLRDGSSPVPWGEDEEELDDLGEGLPLADGSGTV